MKIIFIKAYKTCRRPNSTDSTKIHWLRSTWSSRRSSGRSHDGASWGCTCCGCQRWGRTHRCRWVGRKTTARVVRWINLIERAERQGKKYDLWSMSSSVLKKIHWWSPFCCFYNGSFLSPTISSQGFLFPRYDKNVSLGLCGMTDL